MEPGREESLLRRIAELEDTVAELKAMVTHLLAENARLKKDSSNSSKPPSSDIVKPPQPPKPGGGQRKRGGQPGHPKHPRTPFPPEQVDRIVHLDKPNPGDLIPLEEFALLQQVELPQRPIGVTEYRARLYRDPTTGRIVQASFPPEVEAAGLLGPRLTTLVAYLKSVLHVSFSNIRHYFRDVLQLPISRGQLARAVQKVSRAMAPAHEQLAAALPRQKQLHVDETGHKENGKTFWSWCFRSEGFTFFKIDSSRGSKVLLDTLGRAFNGLLGCDYFSAYRKYMDLSDAKVQFCLAHLIRDVKFLLTLSDKVTRNYGQRLLKALRKVFRILHRRETLTPEVFQRKLEKARDKAIRTGRRAPPRIAAQNLAERFRKHGEAYFRFITSPEMAPTNNLAEQAIRFVVLDRHVTQGTRSPRGREFCQRAWTAIATCQQQGRSVFHFMKDALHAMFHRTPAPSLLPA